MGLTHEIRERTELNYKRLSEGNYYKIEQVFSPKDYDWPADKEGRALLAFVSHYKISGKKVPCMEQMLGKLDEHLNNKGYLGNIYNGVIDEQQISGHSWLLRGLCEYYEQFGGEKVSDIICGITNGLYLTAKGRFFTYPTNRQNSDEGEVSGSTAGEQDGWKLSTDIGCAFMSIDGLSHAYKITRDNAVKALVDEMIQAYLAIDKLSLRVQTHCTLTAARGMIRMYDITKADAYLDGAKEIYNLYVNCGGMTYTYQNLNWWGRNDSWTEPCGVVDSLMVALELYKATGDMQYRRMAARIYHNGFATIQRDNGGAGTDHLVCSGSRDSLSIHMYEAYFCCSMRLAEGLWYVEENKELLHAEVTGAVMKDKKGIYSDGDIIYCMPTDALKPYGNGFVMVDGLELCPIIKLYKVPKSIAETSKMKIVF